MAREKFLEEHVAGKTMKALVLRKHGGLADLEVVGDYPVPQATEGNVVIRVRASSFNYHDVFTVKGMPGIKVPLPVVIGLDMAGEISEIGPGVTGWGGWGCGGGGDLRNRSRRHRLADWGSRAGESAEQEDRPDGRDARRRHGGILSHCRRSADPHARRRQFCGGGLVAGRGRDRA